MEQNGWPTQSLQDEMGSLCEEELLYNAITQNEEFLLREILGEEIVYIFNKKLWPNDPNVHTVTGKIGEVEVTFGIKKHNGDINTESYKRSFLLDLSKVDLNDSDVIKILEKQGIDPEKLKDNRVIKITQIIKKTLKDTQPKSVWPYGTAPTKAVRRIMRNAIVNVEKDKNKAIADWNERCEKFGFKIRSLETIDEDMGIDGVFDTVQIF